MINKKLIGIVMTSLAIVTLTSLNAATMFMSNLDGAQVAPPLGPTGSPNTGSATLTLDTSVPADPKLAYTLTLNGLDLGADPTNPVDDNDVTAIHIHIGAPGANGPHALNVFGLAGGSVRIDDSDVVVDAVAGTVSGIWDNTDEVFTGPGGVKQPFDSFGLSDSLADLQAGNLYFQIHTKAFPDGAIRGQIVAAPIPEPSTIAFMALGLGCIAIKLRRRK